MADILNDMMYLRLSRNRDGTDYTQGFNQGPGVAIGLASHTTANPIVFTTDAVHNLSVGDYVIFSGVTGTDAADLNSKVFAVTVVGSTTTFSIAYNSTSKTLVTGSATATTVSAEISSVSTANPAVITTTAANSVETGDTVLLGNLLKRLEFTNNWTPINPIVLETEAAHGLTVGDSVTFSGVSGAQAGDFNGQEFSVSAVGSAVTFSVAYDASGMSGQLNFTNAQAIVAGDADIGTYVATRLTSTTFSVPLNGAFNWIAGPGTADPFVNILGVSKYVPVYVDGLKAGETIATKEIQTEHRTPGVRYKILTGRNADQASLTTPVHPETIKTVLGAVLQKRTGTYLPFYHTIEQYWNATITAASANFGGATGGEVYTGRCLKGCVFNGFSINIDRNSPADWSFNASMFIRREDPLTTTQPTPTWPAQDPYTTGNVYADIVFLDDDGDPLTSALTHGFTGDNLNLISVSVNYQSNLSVSLMRPSSDVAIDLSWTKLYRTAPSAAINGQLVFNASDYMSLTRMASVRHARLRLMGVGSSPSGESTVTSLTISAAATSATISVASTSGYTVGDYVLLSQVTANVQNVGVISGIVTDTSITVLPVDTANLRFIAMTASASDPVYIKNTAWQILVPQFDIQTKEPPSSGGDYKVINFTGTARLVATLQDPTVDNTDVITYGAYNDDGA